MPYFNVEKKEDSPIQKSDFIAKTKSALHYYKDNVSGNNSINALYYIADDHSGKPYENDPGEGGQKNNAHFVELASALAIINFLETPDANLESVDGKAVKPIYKQFSIKNDSADLAFSDFEIGTEEKIGLRLSQFTLFRKFLEEHLQQSSEEEPWRLGQPELNRQFFGSPFYATNVSEFMHAYGEWLTEMSGNRRGFSPFNLQTSLESFIRGKSAKSSWLKGKVDYNLYVSELNKKSNKKVYVSPPQKLVNLFDETTRELLTSRFGFKE